MSLFNCQFSVVGSRLVLLVLGAVSLMNDGAAALAQPAQSFIEDHGLQCHDGATGTGGLEREARRSGPAARKFVSAAPASSGAASRDRAARAPESS